MRPCAIRGRCNPALYYTSQGGSLPNSATRCCTLPCQCHALLHSAKAWRHTASLCIALLHDTWPALCIAQPRRAELSVAGPRVTIPSRASAARCCTLPCHSMQNTTQLCHRVTWRDITPPYSASALLGLTSHRLYATKLCTTMPWRHFASPRRCRTLLCHSPPVRPCAIRHTTPACFTVRYIALPMLILRGTMQTCAIALLHFANANPRHPLPTRSSDRTRTGPSRPCATASVPGNSRSPTDRAATLP
jgi:hypothetical protein